ncbi:hypothetical protein L2E82_23199 [Cichorium intybus]|uniref:Uncharacterized protein n=1 Tax=Cichorium intybus TaxID=13427 RepID=A0ACB9E030_CICIN|nr:hypothetical protein L2E82_23199 [Cichorium intybus]
MLGTRISVGQAHWVLLVELHCASVRGRVLSNGEYYVAVAQCGVLLVRMKTKGGSGRHEDWADWIQDKDLDGNRGRERL